MKSLEQISLFAAEEVKTQRYLHVVHEGGVKGLKLEELFNATKYKQRK